MAMKICVPLRAKTVRALKNQVKTALKSPYKNNIFAFEIWLDALRPAPTVNQLKELFEASGKPFVVVAKGAKEKGAFKGGEKARMELLLKGLEAGARYVDVGMHTDKNLINKLKKACKAHRAKLIISHHDWKQTPSLDDLEKLESHARSLGADIVKIATTVVRPSDAVNLFEFTKRAQEKKHPVIVVGMGKYSLPARVGCALLGSYLTYAALDVRHSTAPGQPTLGECVKILTLE